ncbi:MAG TPA: hypothetical protein VF614_02865 [Chthoniobacteraceae bacterium]
MKALAISLGVALLSLVVGCSPTETVARLDAGGGAQIIVSADNSWEIARPYYYEVHRGGSVAVPRTFLEAGEASGLSFQLVTTTDRRLMALIETHSPDIVWPYSIFPRRRRGLGAAPPSSTHLHINEA